ncbi:MAG: hypothetical protein RL661_1411 [Pseudomonadota bacterium]
MKKHLLVAITLALGGCVSNKDLKPHDWAMDVQTAETREAHNSLADHYEDIAQTMDADAAEERRMLDKYITSPHKYGKQIQDIKGRSNAMIRDFERAATESRKMAAYHRQLANAASKP